MDYGIRSPRGQIWSCDSLETARQNTADAPHMEVVARETGGAWQAVQVGPVVWILSKGEHHEGGEVIAVFADRDLARGQFAHEAQNMAFAIDDARQDEDGSVHLDAGCDWLALEPHLLVTQTQLT